MLTVPTFLVGHETVEKFSDLAVTIFTETFFSQGNEKKVKKTKITLLIPRLQVKQFMSSFGFSFGIHFILNVILKSYSGSSFENH